MTTVERRDDRNPDHPPVTDWATDFDHTDEQWAAAETEAMACAGGGIRVEKMDREQLRAAEPKVAEDLLGGWYIEDGYRLDPRALTMALVLKGEEVAEAIVWLAGSAFALLAAGLWRREPALRYGALAVLLVTVLKVFISDMAGLEGLYRVASFLGLGLSLVAIGWIYQRFVYPVRSGTAQSASPLP